MPSKPRYVIFNETNLQRLQEKINLWALDNYRLHTVYVIQPAPARHPFEDDSAVHVAIMEKK